MLYVRVGKNIVDWHIGEPKPIFTSEFQNIDEIQADGDELVKVLTMFDGTIPSSGKLVQCWYGDIAKTIAFALWS